MLCGTIRDRGVALLMASERDVGRATGVDPVAVIDDQLDERVRAQWCSVAGRKDIVDALGGIAYCRTE